MSALTALFAATLGGPVVKVAAFSYGVRRRWPTAPAARRRKVPTRPTAEAVARAAKGRKAD